MLQLGAEKRRKEEEGLESKASSRSEPSKLESGRPSAANSCKDVECSSSMEVGFRSRDQAMGVGRTRAQEEDSTESDSGSAGFEFQKAERMSHHRSTATAALVPLFSKPAPSKWDDAHKWIASPTSNRGGNKGGGGGQAKKGDFVGYVSRQNAAKAALDVVEEVDTKRVDVSQAKKEMGAAKSMSWVGEHHPAPESGAKPAAVLENPVVDSDVNFSWHDSSSTQSATTFMTPVPTIRAVSMRDMGTEMTPIASQEPSRTGTPIRATSPLSSPPLSQPSTPQRSVPGSTQTDTIHHQELSEKEQHRKTRREIMVLGQQLGKTNIAAWASKEDEELYASTSTNMMSKDHSARSVIEARAAAWEEAEKTKYLARFKQEEIKIMAWENHQKATIEAELRKIEVKVERMRASSHERLMNQLASVRHKAEQKRAAAEAKRNQQAAKTAQQADYIRRTGRIPSKFYLWGWCF
ncbi:uncharacterized protein LOC141840535 [Curcuma longa]|uniref:uncharacterized protein LOC141840535 n=1 Tax=Curcuma longa TaxID=136217 RepID=UPI003D9E645D